MAYMIWSARVIGGSCCFTFHGSNIVKVHLKVHSKVWLFDNLFISVTIFRHGADEGIKSDSETHRTNRGLFLLCVTK